MYAKERQGSAEIDQPFSIEVKGIHRSSAFGRCALNKRIALGPTEMLAPSVGPGVKKVCLSAAVRIVPKCFVAFSIVATSTGQSKVV